MDHASSGGRVASDVPGRLEVESDAPHSSDSAQHPQPMTASTSTGEDKGTISGGVFLGPAALQRRRRGRGHPSTHRRDDTQSQSVGGCSEESQTYSVSDSTQETAPARGRNVYATAFTPSQSQQAGSMRTFPTGQRGRGARRFPNHSEMFRSSRSMPRPRGSGPSEGIRRGQLPRGMEYSGGGGGGGGLSMGAPRSFHATRGMEYGGSRNPESDGYQGDGSSSGGRKTDRTGGGYSLSQRHDEERGQDKPGTGAEEVRAPDSRTTGSSRSGYRGGRKGMGKSCASLADMSEVGTIYYCTSVLCISCVCPHVFLM